MSPREMSQSAWVEPLVVQATTSPAPNTLSVPLEHVFDHLLRQPTEYTYHRQYSDVTARTFDRDDVSSDDCFSIFSCMSTTRCACDVGSMSPFDRRCKLRRNDVTSRCTLADALTYFVHCGWWSIGGGRRRLLGFVRRVASF